ncbi:MAG: ribosome silencing factor [Candidatus Fraserbacteria bacterium RBG_16_55_9]|uniref:Ribosomal silencing factor RsfS n=1 Tax=Fraserbacteria sp. (strain RBG_16_55_9) TaxID=1817864 RepID=A0A1F5UXF8_FRAXR|nr:MAG: ribosome silencing factor [Candidatus Fraserbacteria bacterium RBG_16_55_9]
MTASEETVGQILQLIEEKKGEQTVVLDLEDAPWGTDFFVLTGADNPKQLRAIAENIRKGLDAEPFAVEGLNSKTWIVLDYGDVIVHVLDRRARQFYDLEGLWDERVIEAAGDR